MNRFYLPTILMLCLFLISNPAWSATESEKARSRLEDLFLWKVSDMLELDTAQEEKFKEAFKRLNEKRSKNSQEMEALLKQFELQKDAPSISGAIEKYKNALATYNGVQVEEVQTFRKLFGDKKFAQYLILKRDLTQKLKNLLSEPSRLESAPPKDQVRDSKSK
ncbi:MAG: hypothetical protein AB7F59_14960 [Bdellovibrionales bacterium]